MLQFLMDELHLVTCILDKVVAHLLVAKCLHLAKVPVWVT
jgi:hypothetical protein